MSRAFIGRREELAALHDARRDLAASHGAAVLIGGETGIGKSRLLTHFVQTLREAKSRRIVVTADCLERIQQPFGPIRSFVSALLRVSAGELPSNVARAIAQLTRSTLLEGDGSVDHPVLERAELFAALVDFIRIVVARNAAILAIEDLQWADPSTLDFIVYAVPRLARSRFLLLATYRSDELERNEPLFNAVSELSRETNVRRLSLAALSKPEIRDLVDDALEGRVVLPAAVRSDLELRSEGNPFFAEELVKSALEARNASSVSSLPLSIRASILRRLATLTADDRRILERAAVLGYRFDPTVLALVMEMDVEAILPTLRRARDLSIVVEEGERDSLFRFRHALTRQTIYSGMLVFDARRLHARILHALESLDDRERYIDTLAYHAWEAKDARRTLLYNEAAGNAALAQRALSEAAACFDRAREVATDELDRARLAESAGTAASMQGRLSQAVDLLETAYAIRLRRGELDEAAQLQATIIVERNNLGDAGAPALGEAFLEQYGAALGHAARDRLLVNTARLVCANYDFTHADRLLAAVSNPEELAPRVRQNYLITLLERHFYYGETSKWLALLPQLASNSTRISGDLQAIAEYTLVQMGSYMGANHVVERALLDAKRIERMASYGGIAAFGEAARAAYYLQRGRLKEARADVERALERPDIAVAAIVIAQTAPLLAISLGDADLVSRCISPAFLEQARNHIDVEHAIFLGAHAEWLASRGQAVTAKSDLRLALKIFPKVLPTLGPVLVSAARHLEVAELAGVIELAERSAGTEDNLAGRATRLMVSAIAAARRQEQHEAVAAALAAAALGERLGWPIFEARALEIAGEIDRARGIYVECEASGDIARFAAVPVAAGAVGADGALSSRELEVALLIALGLTNKAISERLFVGQKTVEKHIASIFRKLDINSRMHIAAFVARRSETETRT